MKLSEQQQRCLAELEGVERKSPGRWTRSGYFRMRPNTLDSLEKLGLVERRLKYPTLDYEYRIRREL